MRFPTPRISSGRAQAAAELAVFGAILVFVIGLIVRTAVNNSQAMNHQLKAMRLAMTLSYSGAPRDNTARNTANILVVEDRLTVDVGSKLSTRDRAPNVANGSATFTNQLFQGMEFGETHNLPVFDLVVNGQRFIFSTSGFKTVTFNSSHPDWEHNCFNFSGTSQGCVVTYQKVYNYAQSDHWCGRTEEPNCGGKNMIANERYDLNRDGTTDVPDTDEARERFLWQWVMVPAINKDYLGFQTLRPGDFTGIDFKKEDLFDVDGDNKEEVVYLVNQGPVLFSDGGTPLDPSDDIYMENITSVGVVDNQIGDYDGTLDDSDYLRDPDLEKPGLQDDMQMFSFTRPGNGVGLGTYLRVEQGKLFNPVTGNFERNTNRQNHVDIIQRIFRVSNNTGRFCQFDSLSGTWSPTNWGALPAADPRSGYPNPVEECFNCFSPENVARTCMDPAQKLIFIRSRIADMRGRRWVTRTDLY